MPDQPARHSALEIAGCALWENLRADLRADSVLDTATGKVTAINLSEELAKPHSETLAEVAQHLRDLGYLKRTFAWTAGSGLGSSPNTATLLARALSSFRADEAEFDRWFVIQAVRGWTLPPLGSSSRVSSHELEITAESVIRLRALTSLDGVLRFREVPEGGQTSLASRVANHLFRIYGIVPDDFAGDTPWSADSAAALHCCGRLLKLSGVDATPRHILDRMLDFDAVEQYISSSHKKWDLSLPAPAQGDWSFSIAAQVKSRDRFLEIMDRTMRGEYYHLDESVRTVFGIRLLQISLWQSGHYFSGLDGLWGSKSDAALMRAALIRPSGVVESLSPLHGIIEEGDGTIRIKLPDVLRRLSGGQPTTRHSAALEYPASPADDIGKLQVAIRERLEEIGSWYKASSGEISQQEAITWNRLYEEVDTGEVSDGPYSLRVNYGMRSLARGVKWLLGKLKNIVSTVKKKVVSFIKGVAKFVDELVDAVTGAALQAFRFLKRGLTGAIRVAALAGRRLIRMIRAEPFATIESPTRWILSRFSFDQDAMILCSSAVTQKDVSKHFRDIAQENQALETTLIVGGKVLKILVACSTPVAGIGAIRLALDIFRALSRAPLVRKQSSAAARALRGTSTSTRMVSNAPFPSLYLTA